MVAVRGILSFAPRMITKIPTWKKLQNYARMALGRWRFIFTTVGTRQKVWARNCVRLETNSGGGMDCWEIGAEKRRRGWYWAVGEVSGVTLEA